MPTPVGFDVNQLVKHFLQVTQSIKQTAELPVITVEDKRVQGIQDRFNGDLGKQYATIGLALSTITGLENKYQACLNDERAKGAKDIFAGQLRNDLIAAGIDPNDPLTDFDGISAELVGFKKRMFLLRLEQKAADPKYHEQVITQLASEAKDFFKAATEERFGVGIDLKTLQDEDLAKVITAYIEGKISASTGAPPFHVTQTYLFKTAFPPEQRSVKLVPKVIEKIKAS